MTLKIKTPTKRQPPDSLLGFGSVGKADARELLAIEVVARDAQWLELVGPVVEALNEAVDLAWLEDSHLVQFDGTVVFGPYYDYSGLTDSSRIEFLGMYECIVWRSGGKWSAYCTYEGSTWFERFDSAEDAKKQCMLLLDKVLPDHPAMRARAALRAITEEQEWET